MNQKGFRTTLLIVLIVAVAAIGGYLVFSKRLTQPGSTTSPTITPAQAPELVGKWMVVSIEEGSIQIVPEESDATLEFFDNRTYKTSGGCNEMSISSYTISSDLQISFKVGGTKRQCARNIVEFWDLAKVYSYELNDKILLLRYKTDAGVEGIFRLQKS